MELADFQDQVRTLQDVVVNTIETFFASRGLPFNRLEFTNQVSVDLDQLAREAHFFGADLFPDMESLSIAA